MAKTKKETKTPKKNRRKGPRTVHKIDKNTTSRDLELARSDLSNFFLDIVDKHHGGW